MLVFPLYKISPYYFEDLFLWQLTTSIQKSGSVIIKLFQYLSHRPDLVNSKMIEAFKTLREQSKKHSIKESKEIIEKNQVKEIHFTSEEPIASGVFGQVYKIKLDDKLFALKIRHPGIIDTVKNDLFITFSYIIFIKDITNFLSQFKFLKWMKIPVDQEKFNQVMLEQSNFRIEGNNLNSLKYNFEGLEDFISFPEVYYQSDDLLIESFIDQSQNLQSFIDEGNIQNKKCIAKLGIRTIFKMIIFDNFVHSDCHAGNLLIQDKVQKEQSNYEKIVEKAQTYLFDAINSQFFKLIVGNIFPETVKILDLLDCNQIMESVNCDKKLVMIDAGMTANLSQNDHKWFLQLIYSIVLKNSQKCSESVFNMSQFYNTEMSNEQKQKNQNFENDLKEYFNTISNITLQQLNLGQIVQQIIQKAQNYDMIFDGNLAILLSNVVILEGLARSLDPNINIIEQAVPYLMNKNIVNLIKN